MKKIFTFCVSLLAALSVFAYDFQSGDLFYNITSSSAPYTVGVTYEESGYDNYSGLTTATIPASVSYNGITYSVTSIGYEAFGGCSSLTSITIPNSVTSIGDYAFCGCEFTSITIPNSVTSIGEYAFGFCFSLTSITIPNSITSIGSDAFYHCTSLASITIPNSVTSIGEEAFYYCESLTSITIPNSVTSIGEGAFFSCSSLSSITIPNSVTSIGNGAFSSCSSLTSITIPNSVTSIGDMTFYGCSSLTSVAIPNSVTSIGGSAFEFCSSLTSVTIPNSVTSIGERAFVFCESLTIVNIPNDIANIAAATFGACTSLKSITIPNSVTSIGELAFYDCDALTSIVVDSGNTTYDSRENCNAIIKTATNTLVAGCQSTIIPNSVTSIGDYAFGECEFLTSVTIPNNVTSIGKYAFYDCSSLDTIHVEATTPPALEDSTVFRNTPSPVCVIPCGTLAAYEASDWASQVGSFVEDCVEGQQIYYTSTDGNIVTPYKTDVFGANIVSNTYQDGKGVITFDGPVTSIGDYAFEYCSSLTSITIPNSVTSIGERAFSSSSSLTSMTVENGNTVYDSRENCNAIIETATNTLIAGCQNTIIPNSVTSIGNSAFEYCRSLTSITIPNSVTSIGDYAFYCCFSLTSITIPNSVTSIGERASYGCDKLTSITIPNSVTSIGEMAFASCDKLTSMVVESGNIIYDSRENCDAIIETATNTLIAGCKKTIIPNSVTSIGHNAFYWCTSLTSITIPNSVTSIGDYAFDYCFSLTSITIPNSVTSIGGRAFYGCDKLDTIHLEATTPPALGYSKVFTSSPICVIPCGTLAEYEISEWKNYVEAFVFDDTCDSKWCGDELYWKYGDGVLTIIGIGDMYDYASDTDVPWYDVHDKITSINISNGVSKIGNNAFTACISLNEIYVGATMPPILGDNALPSSSICLTPCGTLAVYEASDWANQVGSFEEFCPAVVKAKVPASWEDDDITVWVWTDGAGTEYPTTKDGDWYVYTHSVAEEFNIIFKSGTGWKGDTYQTVDINGIKKNTCLQIQSTSGKATYSIVDCEMMVDTTEYFITYTSTDGNIVTPNKTDVFGTNIISNTYVNGVGRLYFDGIVTSIGDSAFYNCETLSSITLPETVTLLGYGSFDDCTSLTKIRVKATTPPKMLGGYTFHNAPLDTCLIPCGTLDAYQSSDWASQVGEFVEVCPAVVKAKVPASWENDDITVWVWTDGAGTEYPTTKEGDWYVYTHTDTEEFNIIFKSGKGWKDERTKTVDIKGITENTCLEIQPTTGKATYTIVDCPSIIYELNGGVTNDYGWMSKADMWEAFSTDAGISVGTLDEVKAVGNPYTLICTPLAAAQAQAILDNAKWDWLEAYIMTVQNADAGATALVEGTSSAGWRYAMAAFFVEGQRTAWPRSADFSKAGKDEAYIPTWKHAYANPTEPTDEFALNAPYREGYTFLGWYTNADFSGEKVTTINAETTGTLYAKWINSDWIITYTSTNGNIVTPYATDVFGANIVSNIYENGVGTITFDGPVTSIGYEAFYECLDLISITIPNSVTGIGYRAFYHCTSLASITIPNSVTSIGDYAFYQCTSLTSITLPNSVTSIGDWAFYNCRSLASITIPNSVTSIGDGAFAYCKRLTSITIPNSVTSIGYNAFGSCSSLTSMTVENGNTVYDSRENCNAIIETATNTLIAGCQNTVIHNSVTSIGDWAFCYCDSLTSITIPNSVTSIGYSAFASCSSLPSLTVPDGVTRIGACAFIYCYSLTSITIPNSVTNIGYSAFAYCSSFDTIYVETTTPPTLGIHIFEETPSPICVIPCGSLSAYEASDWASQVGSFVEECVEGQQITYTSTNDSIVTPYDVNAFDANIVSNVYENGVGTITFDGPLTRIGTQAFHDCFTLTSIIVPNSVKIIGNAAFSGTYLESVVIGSGVTSIGEDVFGGCGLLTSIVVDTNNTTFDSREDCNAIIKTSNNILVAGCKTTVIPNTIKGIGNYAFAGSWEMTSIEIPYGVETIGSSAFGGCTVLRSVTLPNSLVTIGDDAFSTCPALTSITIPSSVKTIGADAFWCDYALDTIYVEATTPPTLGYNPFYNAPVSHCFIPCGTLAAYKSSAWASQVGEFVEDCVEGQQIYYTSTDSNIVTPCATDVFGANIVSNTYEDGQGVITFDGPVTSIGDRAFYGCSGLTSITIPNSVTSIGYNTFGSCSSLTSITIPNSVTSIGGYAFFDCSALTSIVVDVENTIYDSRENCNAIIETATNTLITGCQNTIIPNSVTSIGESAFFDCSSLTTITIPNSVTSIGRNAFRYCSGLTTITISNSVTSIGDYAFSGCSSLDTIHIEAITPPTLGTNAFTSSPTCYIPCSTLDAYQSSDWAQYVSEFVEEGCAPVQQCGDNLFWEYADGVLTITGIGDMYDYAVDTDVPWYGVRGNIKTINMPDEMTKIGDYAFYMCTALTNVTLPEQLKHIGNRAFAQDTKIAGNIVIPEGVNYIEERAFFNLTGVSQFQVLATTPPTLESTNVFTNVNAPIVIPCGYGLVYRKANIWKDLNLSTCEVLIDNLYYMPVGDNEAHIIGYDNKPAGTLTIPGSVVIGSKTRTVTTLADSLFFDCKEISSVIFNEGLESIGERAYVRCGLTGTIVLPSTLTTIGERAFSYCDNVEKYILQAMTPPALANDVFTGSNSKALFYVSCEAMDDYKVATNWSSLKSRLRDACLNIYHYNTALGANGVYTTEDTLVASIYYRRQFTPNSWETLYLPFEVDRVTVLEEGVEYDLIAWNIFGGGHYYLAKPYGIENKEVVFGFTQMVDAHTPYIIQFKDVYYRDKIITFYGKESWNKLSTSFEMLPTSFEMQMAGNTTLQNQLLEEPVYMLRGASNFILQNTTTTLHPFECYVMPYATSSATPTRMNVRFRGDVPTAVESVKGNESHLTYSVDGYTLTVYPQGQAFSIYSLNGALIYSCEAGKEAVDCELNSGCYLLHAGAEAHKIML